MSVVIKVLNNKNISNLLKIIEHSGNKHLRGGKNQKPRRKKEHKSSEYYKAKNSPARATIEEIYEQNSLDGAEYADFIWDTLMDRWINYEEFDVHYEHEKLLNEIALSKLNKNGSKEDDSNSDSDSESESESESESNSDDNGGKVTKRLRAFMTEDERAMAFDEYNTKERLGNERRKRRGDPDEDDS